MENDTILAREYYAPCEELRKILASGINRSHRVVGLAQDDIIIRIWALYLGTLLHDVTGAILVDLQSANGRVARMLERLAYEYHIKLRYFKTDAALARIQIESRPGKWARIAASSSALSPAAKADLKRRFDQAKAENSTLTHRSGDMQLSAMAKAVDGDDFEKDYTQYYVAPSALSHGGALALDDVFRDTPGEDGKYFSFEPSVALDRGAVCIRLFARLLFFLQDANGPLEIAMNEVQTVAAVFQKTLSTRDPNDVQR